MVAAGTSPIIDKSFPSVKNRRRDIIDEIINTIISSIPPEASIRREELVLTIDEAVTNAMEHGNRWNPDKSVHVIICRRGNELVIKVTDEGTGFDTSRTLGNQDKSTLDSRGRGIPLIMRLSRARWNSRGNQIEMHIPLD